MSAALLSFPLSNSLRLSQILTADIDKDFDIMRSLSNSVNNNSNNNRSLSLEPSGIDNNTNNNSATEVVLQDDGVTAQIITSTSDSGIQDFSSSSSSSSSIGGAIPDHFSNSNNAMWKERRQREEIYSSKYRPSGAEEAELSQVEDLLFGMKRRIAGRSFFPFAKSASASGEMPTTMTQAEQMSAWNAVARPTITAAAANTSNRQQQQLHPSLVLKRGPCLLLQQLQTTTTMATAAFSRTTTTTTTDHRVGSGEDAEAAKQQQFQECVLILLTRGLVVATTTFATNNKRASSDTAVEGNNKVAHTGKKKNRQNAAVPRHPPLQFYCAVPWSRVEFVQPSLLSPTTWMVHYNNNNNNMTNSNTADEAAADTRGTESSSSFVLTLVCSDAAERAAWLQATETVLVKHHEFSNTRQDLGWQYHYIYKPGFTMAVTNHIDLDTDAATSTTKTAQQQQQDCFGDCDLNAIDYYNGLAPLHYAVKYNHVPAIATLLETNRNNAAAAAADPNVKDSEGHTPMYWAVRENLPESTLCLLEQYGATKRDAYVKAFSQGELFGKVAATERIMEEKHREVQLKAEAEAAANEIKNNLKLLQQRGEQIDEIGNKASDLNQGAQDFASMARQLKEASKNKSNSWLPF